MALGLNKVVLIGNVGRDPEFRFTNDNKELATFSFATTETWRDKATGDKKEYTEWHKVVVFSESLIDIIKNYVKKGNKLYLEGSIRTRKWVDQSSNQERYSTEIILQNQNTLILLDNKRSQDQSYGDLPKKEFDNNSRHNNDLDDEIPF